MSDNAPATQPNAPTLGELARGAGLQPNSARQAFKRAGFTDWSVNRAASPIEYQWFTSYQVSKKVLNKRNKPAAPAQPTAPRTEHRKTTAPTAKPWYQGIKVPNAYDLIIWAEISLGLRSVSNMFGLIGGFIAAGVMTIFFEAARRAAALPLRSVERSDFDTDAAYNAAYNAAAAHNEVTRRYKRIHFTGALCIGAAFCWANGNALYAHTSQYADFATARVLDTITYADASARVMALFLTGLAVLSLRAITLRREL